MNNKRLEILTSKFCTNHIDTEEIKELKKLLEDDNNKIVFQQYLDLNHTIEQSKKVNVIEKEAVLKAIKLKIKSDKRKPAYWKYAIAASVLLLISLSLVFNKSENKIEIAAPNPKVIDNVIEIGTSKATLTLEDGSNVALEKNSLFSNINLTSNGKQLVYNNTSNSKTEVVYNYLTIPRGGQYFVTLNDGTKVWLNSDSKLKYPVAFAKNETRQVELIYGEAYFDVSPSTKHSGAKFKVLNKSQDVEVLGTEFNIKAYKDETNIYTTLIDGKVLVNNGITKKYLEPNQQVNLDILNNNISISTVDVNAEISWKNGLFIFRGKSLKNIMRAISRWYDIDVIFLNKELEDIKFKGVLGKDQNIDEILKTIKNLNIINNYEINDKTIIIK